MKCKIKNYNHLKRKDSYFSNKKDVTEVIKKYKEKSNKDNNKGDK